MRFWVAATCAKASPGCVALIVGTTCLSRFLVSSAASTLPATRSACWSRRSIFPRTWRSLFRIVSSCLPCRNAFVHTFATTGICCASCQASTIRNQRRPRRCTRGGRRLSAVPVSEIIAGISRVRLPTPAAVRDARCFRHLLLATCT